MTTTRDSKIELAAWLLLAAGLGVIQFTIFAEEILALAAILWVVLLWRDGWKFEVPAFFWPLAIYAGLTLVGCCFSPYPGESFGRSKQLLLFLVVPLTARLAARNGRATTIVNVIIALGAVGALLGVFEYALLNYDSLDKRPLGSLGHYMTYSGVIMLVLGAAVSRLLFSTRPRLWPAIAVPALVAALGLTVARNAWVGAGLAILVLLAFRSMRLFIGALVAIPVLAGAVFVAGPGFVRERMASFTNKQDTGYRDRIAMLEAGVHMVKDHPFFGVGLNIVPWAWDQKYRPADAVDPQDGLRHTRSHLHNVPMQIAAERGLPALAVWIWFVAVALRDLARQMRRRQATAIAAAGLAAVIGMLAAGMFEYNFGDSEFLILFLGLITLPWAAAEAERRKDVPAAMAA